MSRRPTSLLAAGFVGLLVVSSCAVTDPAVRTRGGATLAPEDTQPDSPFEPTPEEPTDTTIAEEPTDTTVVEEPTATEPPLPDAGGPEFTLPDDKTPREYDEYVEAVVNDIQNFWRNEFPATYGSDYVELANGVHAMEPGSSVTPGCGEPTTDYSAVELNAFYCTDADFIAYDDAQLIPQLIGELGEIAFGVVMAHEWGHAIQGRIPYEDETIFMEQQADCFAGAWVAHLARGESTEISFEDKDLANALQAMIFVRDQPGTTAFGETADPLAHGSAFDRVGAFEDGFRNGTVQCATYPENKPTVIQFGYDPRLDIESQENAPLEDDPDVEGAQDIFGLLAEELNKFWPATAPGVPTITLGTYTDDPASVCDPVPDSIFSVAFYCPASTTVFVEQTGIVEIYNNPTLRDFGVGYVIATAWSEAVLDALGAAADGEERALAADCMVGSFAHSVLPEEFNGIPIEGRAVLSPGDLDEAVSTAIAAGDESEDADDNGTPFDKVVAFRQGVLGQFSACQERFGF